MARRALILATITLAALTASAGADTIHVKPGRNAIQKAVDRADPGDRLLIKRGTYREDVVVDKRLRIIGKDGKARTPPTTGSTCSRPARSRSAG